MKTQWMIYGANGYTGELIARKAVAEGQTPVIAGRNRAKVEALANELGLEYRIFGLDGSAQISAHINDMSLVLHCAGPFSVTAEPMMLGCIAAQCHYLDITGEIQVFELAQSLNDKATQAGVVLCPGVGFDVVPTDCVALKLKELMPDATHLSLGFDSAAGFSPGTAKTTLEGMADGGKVRLDGKISTVKLAYKVERINFGNGLRDSMTIPWGDVATAYYTTGIANIETFIPAPKAMVRGAKLANWFKPLLGMQSVQGFLKSQIDKKVKGPSESERKRLSTYVWGKAINAKGQSQTVRIKTAHPYELTIETAFAIASGVASRSDVAGAITPAKLMGSGYIETMPGSGRFSLDGE